MKLYIDTSDNKKTIIGLDNQLEEFTSTNYRSQQLVALIEKVLTKQKKELKDLTAIEINLGPGSFTGLRIGVAVANALSWALDIPLNNKRQLLLPKYE